MRDFFPYPPYMMEMFDTPRPKLCREFRFRMERDPNEETYLSEDDVRWFIDELVNRAVDKYIEENKEDYYAFLQKYLVEHPDGRWSNYFYSNKIGIAPYSLDFKSMADERLYRKAIQEIKVPKKNSRKHRILIEDEDVDFVYEMRKRSQKLQNRVNSLQGLRYEVDKLLSREELFKVFPKAEKLFAERDAEKARENEKRAELDIEKYSFIDELLD